MTNALTLALPIAFVSNDVLQVLIHIDVVRTYGLTHLADDLFGKAYLAGYLDGEGATWTTDRETEKRAHLVAVIKHRPIDKPRMLLCVGLEILVVCSDDSESSSLVEAMQEGLRNSPTDRWLRTSTKFVYEQERSRSAFSDEVLHITQVRTISTKVIFDRLLIPDVNIKTVEDAD